MDFCNEIGEHLQKTVDGLNGRNRKSLWLKEETKSGRMSYEDIVDASIMPIIQGIQQRATLVDVACSIGHKLRNKRSLKIDTHAALSGGLIILECFAKIDFLGTKRTFINGKNKKRKKHPVYHLFVKDNDSYEKLLESMVEREVEETPLSEPAKDWEFGFSEETGDGIIRHGNIKALKSFNKETNGYTINALNKLQRTGYTINDRVLEVYIKCMNLTGKSPFKHAKEDKQESRASMLLEAKAIRDLSKKNLNNTFYHRYNCDFRGRIYPGTAFLHEQSSDNAKGLLCYDYSVALGQHGAYYLAIHTANCIGQDKLPLDGRVDYINDNMEEICSWAEDPMVNTGWMDADKSWSALAAAFEWLAIDQWVNSCLLYTSPSPRD